MDSIQNQTQQDGATLPQSQRMGEALIEHAKLKPLDVERILTLQKEKNILFGEAAKQLGLIKDSDLRKVLSQQFDYSYMHELDQKISPLLAAAHMPFSAQVEKLRSLRGQLLIRWFEQGHKTLAISSVSPEDGASQLIANLAIVFSQLNKKTLLLDANLRKPEQHKLFGIETKVGLSNILANRQGSYELSRHKQLPNLSILAAGTEVPNPQELLSKSGFSELLADLENVYDVILVDTSPLSLGSDLLTVISKVKATVIVARKDYTMLNDVEELNTLTTTTGATVVGSVFQEI